MPVNTNHTQNCVAYLNLKSGWPTAPKVMVMVMGEQKAHEYTYFVRIALWSGNYYLYALVQSIWYHDATITGLVTEDIFYSIFSKFFPLGGDTYNGTWNFLSICGREKCLLHVVGKIIRFNVSFGLLPTFRNISGVIFWSQRNGHQYKVIWEMCAHFYLKINKKFP